MRKLFYFIFC